MFCQHCGTELNDKAKFCSSCGAPLRDTPGSSTASGSSSGSQDTVNTEPLLTLEPVFIPWVTIASIIPITIFFTIWATGFFGIFAGFGLSAIGAPIPAYAPAIVIFALCVLGIPGLAYYAQKNTYAETQYRFYPDRLEYAEGFFTIEQKTVRYDRIVQSRLRRGIVQKMYGLGTIYLSTPAETGNKQFSGIKLKDIRNPDEVYEQVQRLVT